MTRKLEDILPPFFNAKLSKKEIMKGKKRQKKGLLRN